MPENERDSSELLLNSLVVMKGLKEEKEESWNVVDGRKSGGIVVMTKQQRRGGGGGGRSFDIEGLQRK